MNRKYKPQSKGYLIAHRSLQGLLVNPDMNFSVIGAYLFFSFQADWDKRHEYYRAITPNDSDLAKLWSCSESTVNRNRKKLIKLGLLEVKDRITYIRNLDLFNIHTIKALKGVDISNLHIYYSKSETELAEMMLGISKTHDYESEM